MDMGAGRAQPNVVSTTHSILEAQKQRRAMKIPIRMRHL